MNIDDEGRRKGAQTLRLRREATPDVGYSSQRGNEEFGKLIGGRRFDDKPTKTTKPNTPEQLELFGPEVDLGKKENT